MGNFNRDCNFNSINKCLNCEGDLIQITGRQKKFCSKKCRMSYWHKKNKEKHNTMMRKVYQDNKEKYKTRQKTLKHLYIPEGLICQNCHLNPATERHHSDYSKPMDILFVCKECNEKLPSI